MRKRTSKQPARKKASARKVSSRKKASTRKAPTRKKKASTRKKAAARKAPRKKASARRKPSAAPVWMGEPPAVRKPRKLKLSQGRICGKLVFVRRDQRDVDHYEMTIGTPTQPALARLNLTENEHGWFCERCDKMPLAVQQAALAYIKTLPRRKVQS